MGACMQLQDHAGSMATGGCTTFSISSASSKTKILANLKLRILFDIQFFSVPCVPMTTCSVIL
jgi:hypothetical protein